jgi:antitoxin component YwqK of YwqJK toxin-antitoxin module
MRQHTLLLILTLALGKAFGQSDTTTVYKGLETRTFYSVGLSAQIFNGQGKYQVNGKEVSKVTYDKFQSTWKNMETCCPCILKFYDENDVLLRESVSCTDCGVGYFKEFYPNGNAKLTGHYKENPGGHWDDLWARGFCSVKDGEWIYFNEQGEKLYSEFWKNGEFIKQVPEQMSNEIWKVELTLNGESVDKKPLTPEQVRQLTITPRYKNNAKTENSLTVKFTVSAVSHKPNEKSFTLENFKTIDVLRMLSEAGIPSGKKTTFSLSVIDNGKTIANFYLDIPH